MISLYYTEESCSEVFISLKVIKPWLTLIRFKYFYKSIDFKRVKVEKFEVGKVRSWKRSKLEKIDVTKVRSWKCSKNKMALIGLNV